ncbi:MAG: GAF domain-containing protein [Betaproteobacteria bacterium]|nr:GAF domain-containing protein [Betaproteobacteria bacterium]
MFQATPLPTSDKATFYRDLDKQLSGLLAGERDFIANAANLSALIFNFVPDLNWAGFYLMHGNDLLLGPFQGKPACVRIPVFPQPRGVCGAAAFQRKTQLVPNVHEFPGHIACDSASNSEIVVPLLANGRVIGVLDIDSPTLSRFDAIDQQGIEQLVHTFLAMTDVPAMPVPAAA